MIALKQDAEPGIEQVMAVGLNGGLVIDLSAAPANAGHGVVVHQPADLKWLPAPIVAGQQGGGDLETTQAGEVVRFERVVLVDAHGCGNDAEKPAPGGVQRGGAPLEAGCVAPGLQGAIQQEA